MKSYVFAKKTSIALSYFAGFLVVCMFAVYGIQSMYSSADSNTASDLDVRVMLNVGVGSAPIDSNTDIPISISVTNPFTPRVVDHVDLYATRPGDRIDLPNTDASRTAICTKVGNGELTLVARSTYTNENWTVGHFTAPNTPGIRQIFGVAYSTAATGCNTVAIQGWSIPDPVAFVNIYRAQVSSGFIELSTQTPVVKNTPLTVQASITNPQGVDHISILVLRQGMIGYDSIAPETLCYLSSQVKATIPCSSDTCRGTKQITGLDQTGLHRVVAVAMSSPTTTPCAQANVVSINKENIVCVADANDPNCDGAPGGNGDPNPPSNNGSIGGGSGNTTGNTTRAFMTPSLINPTHLTNIAGVLTKAEWFVFTFVGILAFTAILFGGFTFMTAAGNDQQVKRGKNAIVFGIIGIVIAFLSWWIISISVDALNGIF